MNPFQTYLLYAALKALLDAGQSGQFVEVAMSSEEEVERQSELGECARGRTEYDGLVVDLESSTATWSLPRRPGVFDVNLESSTTTWSLPRQPGVFHVNLESSTSTWSLLQ